MPMSRQVLASPSTTRLPFGTPSAPAFGTPSPAPPSTRHLGRSSRAVWERHFVHVYSCAGATLVLRYIYLQQASTRSLRQNSPCIALPPAGSPQAGNPIAGMSEAQAFLLVGGRPTPPSNPPSAPRPSSSPAPLRRTAPADSGGLSRWLSRRRLIAPIPAWKSADEFRVAAPAVHAEGFPKVPEAAARQPGLQRPRPVQYPCSPEHLNRDVSSVAQTVDVPGLVKPLHVVVEQEKQGRLRAMPPELAAGVPPGPPVHHRGDVCSLPCKHVDDHHTGVEAWRGGWQPDRHLGREGLQIHVERKAWPGNCCHNGPRGATLEGSVMQLTNVAKNDDVGVEVDELPGRFWRNPPRQMEADEIVGRVEVSGLVQDSVVHGKPSGENTSRVEGVQPQRHALQGEGVRALRSQL
mmetsp:Transcript_94741/g.300610  ORF Transcript_94741/g.300610 Transcript_94741/m.300610 type:complete len:407 (-) Transcript_94741:697-1917(-)